MGETEPFVAIRSSATTEDLPNASFAGQHESYLNVRGAEMILAKVQECYASLFTDRATYYRHKQHFPHEEPVPADRAIQPALNEDQIHELAGYVKEIEKHYGCYMDMEFALDARTDRLWLVQARPETVWSNNKQIIKESTVSMNKTEKILIKGLPASPGISTGKVHVIADPKDIDKFEAGEILVTLMTSPDWVPAMKKAAIITDNGGTTCHAAIVSREMQIPCIVGTKSCGQAVTEMLQDGEQVTVDAKNGIVYQGDLAEQFNGEKETTECHRAEYYALTATRVMMNLGDPELADKYAALPVDGIGLM